MKKKVALFLAICTLSGCVNTAPAETISTTATTTGITEEISTTAAITTVEQTSTEKEPELIQKNPDLFPDGELYPAPSDNVTEVIFFEIAEGVKYESETDFPNHEHLKLAKEKCWANERVQEQIKNAEIPANSLHTLPERQEDLTAEGMYHYDFDMDGENESFIHIRYLPFMSCGMLIYVDGNTAEIITSETGGSRILVYDFDAFCYTQIEFYYGMSGISTGVYDLRNGFSEPLVSGTNCTYENGVFYIYRKSEFTDYPVICCKDGVFRQIGREEISREDFETHVKNGAEYLQKLETQNITVNKIETWGHYTYQLTCTDRGADFGINITMNTITMRDDEAAFVRAPYEIAYEPQLTKEYIYGVDVWELTDELAIVPEIIYKNTVSKEKIFVHSEIINQLKAEKPVDTTVYDWYETVRSETGKLDNEIAETAKSNNYASIRLLSYQYIGNEKADWIVSVVYCPWTDITCTSFLNHIFYVKDGKITEYLAEFESDCYIDSYNGRVFISAYNNGIYELNLKTDKLEKIVDATIISDEWPHQNFCRCFAATDEYMIYKDAEECIKIYYFENGNTLKSDIYSGWMDGQMFIIRNKSLIYTPIGGEKYIELNILTGEKCDSDITEEEFLNFVYYFDNENENWYIEPFEAYDLPDIITVKSKVEGKTKNFDMKTALKKHGYDEKHFEAAGLDGDKLYCHSRSDRCYLVLDLAQDTVRLIEQEDDNYHSVSFDSSQIEVYDGEQNYILKIKS